MNYIKHLTGFFEKVSSDFELNPTHISLIWLFFSYGIKIAFKTQLAFRGMN